MIYFLSRTSNENVNNSNKISQIYDVKYLLNYFKNKEIIAVDTETTGFDPYTCKLLTLQLGDSENQFVIDTKEINPYLFKELLEEKTLILQNAKFDLRFFYHHDIWPRKIYDTYLAEVKLNHGLPDVRKNLQVLANKYCNTEDVDKTLRSLIHVQGLTEPVIAYAANDVKYLHQIKEEQEKLAKKQELLQAINLENRFVPTLAYIEYCGIFVDKNKWKEKTILSQQYLDKTKEKLDSYILDNNLIKYIDMQLDLFSTTKKVTINWSSDQQVKKLFKDLGINILITIKGETKESVEASVIKPQRDQFPIINLYLEYKKWEKDVSTYGLNFLKHINKHTGRIHTNFTQIVDTGRMASGGKNKVTGEEYVNLQNIPTTPEDKDKIEGMIYARECIKPQFNTNIFVNADYSGQETVVLANKSKESNIIKLLHEGGDMHVFVAKAINPELNHLTDTEFKKLHKGKRQIAKSAGFALQYGGTGWTIANNLSISEEEGNRIEKAYFEAFPELKAYYNKCEKDTLNNGYILIDEKTGSKFYIAGYAKFLELQKGFYNKTLTKEDRSYFWRWKSQIIRNSLNYPIQGTSANITKYACLLLFDWIIENNYQNIIKIVNVIHDEILLETPQIISDTVSRVLKNCMETAGNFYCATISLKATPEISNYWSH